MMDIWTPLFLVQFILASLGLVLLLGCNVIQWRVEQILTQEVGDIPRLLHRVLPICSLFLVTYLIPLDSKESYFIHTLIADANTALLLYGLTLISYHTRATLLRAETQESTGRIAWCHVMGGCTIALTIVVNVIAYHLNLLWPHIIFLTYTFLFSFINMIAVLFYLLRLIRLLETHNVNMSHQSSSQHLDTKPRMIRVVPATVSAASSTHKSNSFSLQRQTSHQRSPSQYSLQKIAQDIARTQLIVRFRVRVGLLVVPGVIALSVLAASAVYLIRDLTLPLTSIPSYSSFGYFLVQCLCISCATAFGWTSFNWSTCRQVFICCGKSHDDISQGLHSTCVSRNGSQRKPTPKKEIPTTPGLTYTYGHVATPPQPAVGTTSESVIDVSPLSAAQAVQAFTAATNMPALTISPSASTSPSPSPTRSNSIHVEPQESNDPHVPTSFVIALISGQASKHRSSHHPSPSLSLRHISMHEPRLSMGSRRSMSMIDDISRRASMIQDSSRHVSVGDDHSRRRMSMVGRRMSMIDDAARVITDSSSSHDSPTQPLTPSCEPPHVIVAPIMEGIENDIEPHHIC